MNRLAMVVAAALMLGSSLAAQKPATPSPAATPTELVNLNTASATQIATLPGIGAKTADLIIQYRQKNGGFKKIEEIMNVRGVGEKSFLKLRGRITVTQSKPVTN